MGTPFSVVLLMGSFLSSCLHAMHCDHSGLTILLPPISSFRRKFSVEINSSQKSGTVIRVRSE